MQTRSELINAFLARSDWPEARRAALAGDASFRRYERVFKDVRQAVLMDAPPDKENLQPFLHIGEYLLNAGLSAPEIYARDMQNGFLLLEDLGDNLFTRRLKEEPQQEEILYLAATDVLTALWRNAQQSDYTGFPLYDKPLLLSEVSLFAEWFLPAVMEDAAPLHAERFMSIWRELMDRLPGLRPMLVLRDYHADNLLWLPEREGVRRVGLLDFQDGVIGSPAYDVVSFLEDARRDVRPVTVEQALSAYMDATHIPKEDFMAAYCLLGAQRNCKIIGIFTRLAVRDGKRNYLSYLPRVWRHLVRDLAHPLLEPLAAWMDKVVPQSWRGVLPLNDESSAQGAACA